MLSSVLVRLGFMKKQANIAFWGPDVSEITTLVQALKTGGYVRHSRESIHPLSQEIVIGNVTIRVTVPSANMGARLAWRSALSDFDGIVCLVDVMDPTRIALSKEELGVLLNDETLSKPILILAPRSSTLGEEELRQQLNVQEAMTKGERQVALFMHSVSLTEFEGTEAGEDNGFYRNTNFFIVGLQWLMQHVKT